MGEGGCWQGGHATVCPAESGQVPSSPLYQERRAPLLRGAKEPAASCQDSLTS